MYRSLKIKLLVFFIFLVAFLQFIFGIVIIVFEHRSNPGSNYSNILYVILVLEIVFTCVVAYIAGYFYVNLSLKPAEDSYARLERFSEDASHELKTPLSVAVSHLELAQRGDDVQNRIASAREEIIRLSNLIERLLDIAKLNQQTLKLRAVDLGELTKDILRKYSADIEEKHIKVKVTTNNTHPLKCDPLLTEQLISNLIQNAIKFNRPEGLINIEIADKHFSIANSGNEIKNKTQIFERLYRDDKSFSKPGNGIGLYLVKRIVDIHQWSIEVSSTDGTNEFIIKF